MRRLLIAAAMLAGWAGASAADEIWLKDGRMIPTKGPAVTKGSNALLTTSDGVLVSVPIAEIDQEKTAEARRRAASPTPAPTPNLLRPITPAEAAKQKSGRKAVVTLTDDTVAHGFDVGGGEAKGGDGDGRVDVTNTSAQRTKDGYAFTGSVINAGKGPVSGVTVTVEIVGQDGKTFSSAYAQLAKDSLAPGEKSTFSASAPIEGDATSFRYMPRWQVPAKPAEAKAPGADGKTPAEEAPPTPAPTPAPTVIVPIPRPDVAPPSANPTVGNPASGVFLPPTDAPKTTARPPAT